MVDEKKNLNFVANIVASYVANNPLPTTELSTLIKSVHSALSESASAIEGKATETHKPIVSIRASVKPSYIVCLVCGAKVKVLKRHLSSAHGLTPAEYRERYQLPASYPLVAPEYAATRTKLAKQIGLGRTRRAK
jgi:predicted transcriptional regulator